MLVDAGPLVALLVRRDPNHVRCLAFVAGLAWPLITTWPALAEAMYLIGKALGWPGQAKLWGLIEQGTLQLVDLSDGQVARMRALMEQYRDLPMDLADASLVAVAEERRLDRIFTLDSDFHVYRLSGGRTFTVIP